MVIGLTLGHSPRLLETVREGPLVRKLLSLTDIIRTSLIKVIHTKIILLGRSKI